MINNADIALLYFEQVKADTWKKRAGVNIKSVLNGVATELLTMLRNKNGYIINISSGTTHNYFPGGAVYSATKEAIKMFSTGLREDLDPEY